MAKRIQRKRTKGWRMPENTVSVCRPGRWGNPFRSEYWIKAAGWGEEEARAFVVELFRDCLVGGDSPVNPDYAGRITWMRDNIELLRGKNLACFCPLDQWCHADILLELANR